MVKFNMYLFIQDCQRRGMCQVVPYSRNGCNLQEIQNLGALSTKEVGELLTHDQVKETDRGDLAHA